MTFMNPALARWTNKDDRSLSDIMSYDDNGMPLGPHPDGSDMQLRVNGMDSNFPDDLSTIAGDTLDGRFPPNPNDDENPKTPEKKDRKGKPVGDNDDDGDTQPETPTSKRNGDGLESKGYYNKDGSSPSPRFNRCRLLVIACFLGTILLGAIGYMSWTLYEMRNDDDADATSTTAFSAEDPSSVFDFGEDAPTPSWPAADNGQPLSAASIQEIIVSAVPDFYSELDGALTNDPASVQYEVLEWMARDPSISSYSPERILQRFALGVVYWSLTSDNEDSMMDEWMTYTDECQWPTSRTTRSLCDENDRVTYMFMEEQGFNGTLAPEIGLLNGLGLIFLTSNAIQGELPTELGLLTRLERLNLPRNAMSGTLPTELGRLENLGVLGLGNNGFVGTIPSEVGNLERLGSLLLQNNALNGTIPDEIAFLPRLTLLQLEFNNLEGPLPATLGNLAQLEQLSLEGNNFSGAFPNDVCTSSESSLRRASVDCDKVTACACCVGCDETMNESDGGGGDDSATEAPTDSNTEAATTVATMAATTAVPATAAPTAAMVDQALTMAPTATPTAAMNLEETLAPTECHAIAAVRDCYGVGTWIDFEISNCDATEFDVVAMYRTEDLRDSGLRNALFWMPSCPAADAVDAVVDGNNDDDSTAAPVVTGTQCSFTLADGFLMYEGTGEASPLEFSPWPFPAEEYRLFLLRILEPGSLQIMSESASFRVEEQCPTAEPTTTVVEDP